MHVYQCDISCNGQVDMASQLPPSSDMTSHARTAQLNGGAGLQTSVGCCQSSALGCPTACATSTATLSVTTVDRYAATSVTTVTYSQDDTGDVASDLDDTDAVAVSYCRQRFPPPSDAYQLAPHTLQPSGCHSYPYQYSYSAVASAVTRTAGATSAAASVLSAIGAASGENRTSPIPPPPPSAPLPLSPSHSASKQDTLASATCHYSASSSTPASTAAVVDGKLTTQRLAPPPLPFTVLHGEHPLFAGPLADGMLFATSYRLYLQPASTTANSAASAATSQLSASLTTTASAARATATPTAAVLADDSRGGCGGGFAMQRDGGAPAAIQESLIAGGAGGGFSVPRSLIESVEMRDMFAMQLLCKDGRTFRITALDSVSAQFWQRHISRPLYATAGDSFCFAFHAWSVEYGADDIHAILAPQPAATITQLVEQPRAEAADDSQLTFKSELVRLGFDIGGAWRVSAANQQFQLCASYPRHLLVPASISDQVLAQVARFRVQHRVPAVCWRHRGTGAVLARAGQPEVGWLGWRSPEDEQLIQAISEACVSNRPPATSAAATTTAATTDDHRATACGSPQPPLSSTDDAVAASAPSPQPVSSLSLSMLQSCVRQSAADDSAVAAGSEDPASSSTPMIMESRGERTDTSAPTVCSTADDASHQPQNSAVTADVNVCCGGGDVGGQCASAPSMSESDSSSAVRDLTAEALVFKNTAKVVIVDARSYTAAVANRARGGGVECHEYYSNCEIVFMNLPNIHAIRKSFHAVRALLANPNADDSSWQQSLEGTRWLPHLLALMRAAADVCRHMHVRGRSVLVHCSDGWDRTPQISALAQLLMDAHYRTFQGFRVLVEREWLAFGHKFADRCGLPGAADDANERCPVFTQWLDSVYQLTRQFPCAFEFNALYLAKLAVHTYSNLFGTFLCNSWRERDAVESTGHTYSVFDYLHANREHFTNYLYTDAVDGQPCQVLEPSLHPRHLILWTEVYTGGAWAAVTSHSSTTSSHTLSSAAVATTAADSVQATAIPSSRSQQHQQLVRAHSHDQLSERRDLCRSSSHPSLLGSSRHQQQQPLSCAIVDADAAASVDGGDEQQDQEDETNVSVEPLVLLSSATANDDDDHADDDDGEEVEVSSISSAADAVLSVACATACGGGRHDGTSAGVVLQRHQSTSTTDLQCRQRQQQSRRRAAWCGTVRRSPAHSRSSSSGFPGTPSEDRLSDRFVAAPSYWWRRKLELDGLPRPVDTVQQRMYQLQLAHKMELSLLRRDLRLARQMMCDHVCWHCTGVHHCPLSGECTGVGCGGGQGAGGSAGNALTGGDAERSSQVSDGMGSWEMPAPILTPAASSVAAATGTASSSCRFHCPATGESPRLWLPDHAAERCCGCEMPFWLGRRRHHCRACGNVFCAECSRYSAHVPGGEQVLQPVRVCSHCYHRLSQQRQQQHAGSVRH